MNNLKNSGVYMIYNMSTKKRYIGSSTNLSRRKREHKYLLNKGTHENSYLQNAWNKYLEDDFLFLNLLNNIPTEDLFIKERELMLYYSSFKKEFGYNLCVPNIDGSPNHNEETIEKLRLHSYKNIYGNTSEKEYKAWKYEKFIKPKYFPKQSVAKRVFIFDSETGEHIRTYKSIAEASKNFNNRQYSLISKKAKYKDFTTCCGYIIILEEDYDPKVIYKNIPEEPKPSYIRTGIPTKEINAYNKVTGDKVGTFKSAEECANFLGGSKKGINKYLSGEKPSYKGCVFKYTGNVVRNF